MTIGARAAHRYALPHASLLPGMPIRAHAGGVIAAATDFREPREAVRGR